MIKYREINYKILKLYNIIIIFKFIRGYYIQFICLKLYFLIVILKINEYD